MLAVLAVGNLVLPSGLQRLFGVDYMYPLLSALALWAVVVVRRGRSPSLALFAAFALLFSVLPGFFNQSLEGYAGAKLMGFIIAAFLIATPLLVKDVRTFLGYTVWTVYVMCGAASFATLAIGNQIASTRATLVDLNPIGVGRAAALWALMGLVQLVWQNTTTLTRSLGAVAIAVGTTVAMQTGSRGPLVSLAVASALVIVLAARQQWMETKRLPLGPPLLLAVVIASVLAFVNRLAVDTTRLRSTDGSGREELWSQALQLFDAQPFGIGWGNMSRHLSAYGLGDTGTLYAHNVLLELAVEGGVLVLCAFLVSASYLSISAMNFLRPEAHWVFAMPLVLFIYSFSNALFSSDTVGNRTLWLAFGLCAAGAPLNRRR